MKNFIYTIPGGGIFSRILQCAIIPLADKDFDNVYLSLSPFEEPTYEVDMYQRAMIDYVVSHRQAMENYGISNPYEHVISYVIDQKADVSYRYDGYLPIGTIYHRENPIECSTRLSDYKRMLEKIHIHGEIKSRVNDFCKSLNVNERTLGVHVRLTTMSLHTNYKKVTYEDYCNTIDKCLETGKYDNVYVATDNVESLVKMENRYARHIRYYPNLLRLKNEEVRTKEDWSWEFDMFFRKRFWQESFVECMTLARCGGLVCRDSNLSNMAIVFSNTLKDIYRP
jgi:hypothetical protein